MNETSGVLRAAVEAYLDGRDLNPEDVAALRAYCRQWIYFPVWDQNPHANFEDYVWLSMMRADVELLIDRATITNWMHRAANAGLDLL